MNPKLGIILLFGAALIHAQTHAQTDAALVFSDCSDSSDVKRIVQSADTVLVRHSIAGLDQACYSVLVTSEMGDVVEGFLVGGKHPAAIRFERHEKNYVAQEHSTRPRARNKQSQRLQ